MGRDFVKKYVALSIEEMRTDGRTVKAKEICRKRRALLASASDLDLKYLAVRIQTYFTDRSLSDIYDNMRKTRENHRNSRNIG